MADIEHEMTDSIIHSIENGMQPVRAVYRVVCNPDATADDFDRYAVICNADFMRLILDALGSSTHSLADVHRQVHESHHGSAVPLREEQPREHPLVHASRNPRRESTERSLSHRAPRPELRLAH